MLHELLSTFLGRARALLHRRRLDRDLEDELDFHLAMREQQQRDLGANPEGARTQAARRFGNVLALKEACREVWTFRPLETAVQDAGYALRMLRREPGVSFVAVATLALGIGATTTVSAVLDATLLRPLPVPHPEGLFLPHWVAEAPKVSAGTSIPGCGEPGRCTLPFPVFESIADQGEGSWALAGFSTVQEVQVGLPDEALLANVRFVSGNYLPTLGVAPAFGRLLADADDRGTGADVVVLSDAFWRTRYAADPAVVGRGVAVNGATLTVVGIVPRGFHGIDPAHAPDLWIPLRTASRFDSRFSWLGGERLLAPDALVLGTLVRLAPGVPPEHARADLARLFRQLLIEGAAPVYDLSKEADVALSSAARGLNSLRTGYGRPLVLLGHLVRLALAVACANVACLLLARALRRRREIAARLALGASRRRLLAQLFTEGLVLALLGAAFGLPLGFWGSRLLALELSPGLQPQALAWAGPSGQLLASTCAVFAGVTLVFALAPSWAAWRADPAADLLPSRTVGIGWARGSGWVGRLSRAIVTAEVAACLVLVVGAGLFVRTIRAFASFDPGFRTDHLLTLAVTPAIGAEGVAATYAELSDRLTSLPGVVEATWTSLPVMGEGVMYTGAFWVSGTEPTTTMAAARTIGPSFFHTMGIPLLTGRDVADGVGAAAGSAWINQTLAAEQFADRGALGATFRIDGSDYTVEGVVGDTSLGYVDSGPPRPALYVSGKSVFGFDDARYFVLRTSVPPLSLAHSVEAAVREVAPTLLVRSIKDEAQHVAAETGHQRLLAAAASSLGGLTLFLVAVGLYGVLAYSVSRRTGEIAVRMSLGALRGDILRLVLGEGARVVLAGVGLGMIGAWWVARSFARFLFGIGPSDPSSYAIAGLMLCAVAALAMYLPARRASHVDPVVALRAE